MADILKEIDKNDAQNQEISLGELEKYFDDITEDNKSDERQIKKLAKAMEKNLEDKEYDFDSAKIIDEIINKEEKLSELDANTIKVYQLCKRLDGNENIIIDGKIGPEIIYDKIHSYEQRRQNLEGETVSYDVLTKKITVTTIQNGKYEQVLSEDDLRDIDNLGSFEAFIEKNCLILDIESNKEGISLRIGEDLYYDKNEDQLVFTTSYGEARRNLKEFIEGNRGILFNGYVNFVNTQRDTILNSFLRNNNILVQGGERFSITEDNKILLNYQKYDLLIDTSFSMSIPEVLEKEEVVLFIESARIEYQKEIQEAQPTEEFKNFFGKYDELSSLNTETQNIYYNIWRKEEQKINVSTMTSLLDRLKDTLTNFDEDTEDLKITKEEKNNMMLNHFAILINGDQTEIYKDLNMLDNVLYQRNIDQSIERINQRTNVYAISATPKYEELIVLNKKLEEINISIGGLLKDNPDYWDKIGAALSSVTSETVEFVANPATYIFEQVHNTVSSQNINLSNVDVNVLSLLGFSQSQINSGVTNQAGIIEKKVIEKLIEREKTIKEIASITKQIDALGGERNIANNIQEKQNIYINQYKILCNNQASIDQKRDFLILVYTDLGSEAMPTKLAEAIGQYFNEATMTPQEKIKYKIFLLVKDNNNEDILKLLESDLHPGRIHNSSTDTQYFLGDYAGTAGLKKLEEVKKYLPRILENDRHANKLESFGTDLSPVLEGLGQLNQLFGEGANVTEGSSEVIKGIARGLSGQSAKIREMETYVNGAGGEWMIRKLTAYQEILGQIDNPDESVRNMAIKIQGMKDLYGLLKSRSLSKTVNKITYSLQEGNYDKKTFGRWFITEGIVTISAIVVAVGCMFIPGMQGFGIVGMAAVMTAGGMIGAEVGYLASNVIGKQIYGEEFNNKSLLGTYRSGDKIYDPQTGTFQKIKGMDVVMQYGSNFAVGFISTCLLLGAGKMLGGYLNKLANSGNNLNWAQNSLRILTKNFPKMQPRSINISQQKGMAQVIKNFTGEVGEEMSEEVFESVGEKIHPVLGYFVSLYNCLDGGAVNYTLGNNLNVTLSGNTNIPGTNNVTSVFNYDVTQNSEATLAHIREKYEAMEYDVTIENGNIVCTKKLDYTSKSSQKNITGEHTIMFVPSDQPYIARNLFQNNGEVLSNVYGARFTGSEYVVSNTQPGGNKMTFEKYLQVSGFLITQQTDTVIRVRKGNEEFSFRKVRISQNTETNQATDQDGVSDSNDIPIASTPTPSVAQAGDVVSGIVPEIVNEINSISSDIYSKTISELTPSDLEIISPNDWIAVFKNSGKNLEGSIRDGLTLDGVELTLEKFASMIESTQNEILNRSQDIPTTPAIHESIQNLNDGGDYTIYNEFVQYCAHPAFADLLLDARFINNLPPQLREKETFKKIISNSSKLLTLINQENIYGEEITISGSINQYGRTRYDESGREILIQKIIEEGIDPNYILVFRRTQSSGNAKPELYWTTDFTEVFSGLQQEISGSDRENSVVFCSTLAEISSDSRLIRDVNDDGGISLRRINESGYDRQRNLFEIQEGRSILAPEIVQSNAALEDGQRLQAVGATVSDVNQAEVSDGSDVAMIGLENTEKSYFSTVNSIFELCEGFNEWKKGQDRSVMNYAINDIIDSIGLNLLENHKSLKDKTHWTESVILQLESLYEIYTGERRTYSELQNRAVFVEKLLSEIVNKHKEIAEAKRKSTGRWDEKYYYFQFPTRDQLDSYIKQKHSERLNELTTTKEREKLTDSKEIQTMINELRPKGLSFDIQQGYVGNCYFVACLYILKTHLQSNSLIANMIKPVDDGWKISFYKEDGTNWTTKIFEKDIINSKQLKKGQLGDFLIERAYDKFISEYRGYIPGKTMYQRNNKGKLGFEGGTAVDTFDHFFGPYINHNDFYETGRTGFNVNEIKEYFVHRSDNDMFTLASFDKSELSIPEGRTLFPNKTDSEIQTILDNKNGDKDCYYVQDINGNMQEINFGHAYIVGEVNIEEGWIEVINPHDTDSKKFKISIEGIKGVFAYFTKTEFTHNTELFINNNGVSDSNDIPITSIATPAIHESIQNLNDGGDYTIYNEFVQYCAHPAFADLLLDARFINNLPPQLREKETFKKIISNSSKLLTLINQENIYGEEIAISGSINQYGRTRYDESGREILMQKIIEEGIDPNYILVFRRTQSSGNAKPELYWTTDFTEVFSGLQQEISGSDRENSVVFCSTLAEISSDSRLIRDVNDDGGISLRRINESGYDRQRNLFEIQEGRSSLAPEIVEANAALEDGQRLQAVGATVSDVNQNVVPDSDVEIMGNVGSYIMETSNSIDQLKLELFELNKKGLEDLQPGNSIFFGDQKYEFVEKNDGYGQMIVKDIEGNKQNIMIYENHNSHGVFSDGAIYVLGYIDNNQDSNIIYDKIVDIYKRKAEIIKMDLGINYISITEKIKDIGNLRVYESDIKEFINWVAYPFLSQNISGEITENHIVNFIRGIDTFRLSENIEYITVNNFSYDLGNNIYGSFLKTHKNGLISQQDFEYVLSSENENIFTERAKDVFLKTGNNVLIFESVLRINVNVKNKQIIKQLPADVVADMVENFGRNQKMFQGVRGGTINKQEFRNAINQEAEIVANIIDITIEKINKIKNVAELNSIETLQEIYPQIKGMDGNIQLEIISGINQYIANIITIEKYLNMPEYKNDPKRLLADMRGVPYAAIEGEVTVERNGATLSFYMDNKLGYIKIYQANENVIYDSEQGVYLDNQGNVIKESGGFSSQESKIPELEKTLTVTNGAKGSGEYTAKTEVHETRHGVNSLIFRGVEGDDPKTRAKDEIIAYMKDGSDKKRVYSILTNPNGGYTYKMREGTQERKDHVKNLKRDINIAFRLKDAKVPNYIDLLAITPRAQRPQLDKIYIQNAKKPTEKFLDHSTVLIDGRLNTIGGYTKNLAQKIGFYDIVQKYSNRFDALILGDNSFVVSFAKNFKSLVDKVKLSFRNDHEIVKELNDLGDVSESDALIIDQIRPMKEGEALQPEVPGQDVDTKTENLRNLALENQSVFLETLQSFAQQSGSKIEGEQYMVKELDRMREKVNNDYGGDINRVRELKDVLRSTLVFQTVEDINNNFESFKNFLEQRSIEIVVVKNRLGIGTMGDILVNVKFPNGVIAEIKLYTELMFDAQDTPRILPADTKIQTQGIKYAYGNLWTEAEIQYIQKLKNQGVVKYDLSNDIFMPINNHMFYEIDRVLNVTENEVENVDIALLKNKLIAIQQANSQYSMQLYQQRYGRPYIQ